MVTGSNPVEGTMIHFNKIYKLSWIILFFLIIFLSSRDKSINTSIFESSPILSILTILLLIILTIISILRSIESRNQWRKIADQEKVNDVLDEIEKNKEIK